MSSHTLHPLVLRVADDLIERAKPVFVEPERYDTWASDLHIVRIGIHGRKRHGKDTLATAILDLVDQSGRQALRRGIADPLKIWCAQSLGLTGRPAMFWGSEAEREAPREELDGLAGRPFLQQVATEGVRLRWRTDAFVGLFRAGLMQDAPKPGAVICIPDIRFEDEAMEVSRRRRHGDRLVEIIRHDAQPNTDNHVSERGLPAHIQRDQVKTCTSLADVDAYAATIMQSLL